MNVNIYIYIYIYRILLYIYILFINKYKFVLVESKHKNIFKNFINYSSWNGFVKREWKYENKSTLHSVLIRNTPNRLEALSLSENSPILWMCFYFDGFYSIDSVEYICHCLVF